MNNADDSEISRLALAFAHYLNDGLVRLPSRSSLVFKDLYGSVDTLSQLLADYEVDSTIMWSTFVSATAIPQVILNIDYYHSLLLSRVYCLLSVSHDLCYRATSPLMPISSNIISLFLATLAMLHLAVQE